MPVRKLKRAAAEVRGLIKERNETLIKKTKFESTCVVIMLDIIPFDKRIEKTYSELSNTKVAHSNYKFLLINMMKNKNGICGEDWKIVPREFLADEYFVRKMISFGVSYHQILEYLPSSLWNNEEFILSLIEFSKGECFWAFPKSKTKILAFARKAIQLHPENMNQTLLNDDKDFVRSTVRLRKDCLPYIHISLLCDKEFMVSLMLEHNIKNPDFIRC